MNAIYLNLIVDLNDQTALSIDDAGIYEICPVWIDINGNIRRLDLKFSGVRDIGDYLARW